MNTQVTASTIRHDVTNSPTPPFPEPGMTLQTPAQLFLMLIVTRRREQVRGNAWPLSGGEYVSFVLCLSLMNRLTLPRLTLGQRY